MNEWPDSTSLLYVLLNMEKNTNIPLMNFFQISMRLHMEIKKLMSKIHFYFLLQISISSFGAVAKSPKNKLVIER